MLATNTGYALKLKVTLAGSKPPIWRRLLVPEAMTLANLSAAIQEAMGWEGYHLHAFGIAGEQYGDPKMLDDVANQGRYRLTRLVKDDIRKFTYTYDFGDDWEHGIVVEGREPMDTAMRYPVCIAGKRSGPPEDCGGIWGYLELLEILATPDHPEHEERLEWLGGEFDPEAFDIQAVNSRLAARFASSSGRGKKAVE